MDDEIKSEDEDETLLFLLNYADKEKDSDDSIYNVSPLKKYLEWLDKTE